MAFGTLLLRDLSPTTATTAGGGEGGEKRTQTQPAGEEEKSYSQETDETGGVKAKKEEKRLNSAIAYSHHAIKLGGVYSVKVPYTLYFFSFFN